MSGKVVRKAKKGSVKSSKKKSAQAKQAPVKKAKPAKITKPAKPAKAEIHSPTKRFEKLKDTIIKGNVEARMGIKIGAFIAGCSIEEDVNFMSSASGRYRYRIVVDEAVRATRGT